MLNFITEDIGRDPLTGLNNFFEFIRSDAEKLFTDKGSIVIFDIEDFSMINKKFGKTFGDKCLTRLATLIEDNVISLTYKLFRTDGDEFTLILPNTQLNDAKVIQNIIVEEFRNLSLEKERETISVHTIIIAYDEPIKSIDEFYKIMFNDDNKNIYRSSNKFGVYKRSSQIIRSFTKRINETLTLFDKACNLALRDDVSGLQNHRAAKSHLETLNKMSDRFGKPFSVLFIDGDDLKKYNEVSYEDGNKLIRNLADLIMNNIRGKDKAYRWLSGDEFLVVLENANSYAAKRVAERIRKSVEEESKKWLYPVTISIGVASYPGDGKSIDEVINVSESANTLAKKTGKNKVVINEVTDRE